MIGKIAKVFQISPNGRPTDLQPGSEIRTRRTYSGEFVAAEPLAEPCPGSPDLPLPSSPGKSPSLRDVTFARRQSGKSNEQPQDANPR